MSATIAAPELDPVAMPSPTAELEPLVLERPDAEAIVAADRTADAEPDIVTLATSEPDPIPSSFTAAKPDAIAPEDSTPVLELIVPPVLELKTGSSLEAEPDSTPLAAALADAIPAAAEPAAEPLVLELERAAEPMKEMEPVAAQLDPEPTEPVVAVAPSPAPSVFSRRPSEQPAAKADSKVSFAGISKELLPAPSRTPQTEPPASIERPSVEEITRATINDLVGATDKSTAFAKPGGAFSKRPRTIAPPPSDGQPIGAGPKLGAAAKRNGSPAPAIEPAAAEPDAAPAMPQGFEGLQFPNDGVLTRQWMEFLNQMAAGK